jgi:hypothetical protein
MNSMKQHIPNTTITSKVIKTSTILPTLTELAKLEANVDCESKSSSLIDSIGSHIISNKRLLDKISITRFQG